MNNLKFFCFHIENRLKVCSAFSAGSKEFKLLFGISHINGADSERTSAHGAAGVVTFDKVSFGIEEADFVVTVCVVIFVPFKAVFIFEIKNDEAEIVRIAAESYNSAAAVGF